MKTAITALIALALLPAAAATEFDISYSEDFAEELTDNYGEREGDILAQEVIEDMTRAFEKSGVSPARVDVTIINAKPNRPTMEQSRAKPGLDMFRSRSIGGMKLAATAYDADGNELATREYAWFENDIRDTVAASTWSDAKRASDRFARKFAKQLGS